MTVNWRRMVTSDLGQVEAIAEMVHQDYPERPEVFAERLTLYPQGCLAAAAADGAILGYSISHPAVLMQPPALDSLLGALSRGANCLYLHDIALLPEGRSYGLGRGLVDRLLDLAKGDGFATLALTAVNGSVPYWQRQGFSALTPSAVLASKLASYGDDAAYMTRSVG